MKIPGCPWMRITLKFLGFQGSRVGNLKGQFYLDGDGIELQTWEKFDARYEPTYCSNVFNCTPFQRFPTWAFKYTVFFAQLTVNNTVNRSDQSSSTSLYGAAKSCAFVIIEIHARHLHKRITRVAPTTNVSASKITRSVDPHVDPRLAVRILVVALAVGMLHKYATYNHQILTERLQLWLYPQL